ncbi:hypothetical protein DIPPA_11321 [Diplonema papillatum]|nr:hypothetical protein DIPPA_11321 [Diplonema papillatum]
MTTHQVPDSSKLLVRPKHRTRVTVVRKGDSSTKTIEFCDECIPVAQWRAWTHRTEIQRGVLYREVVHPEPELVEPVGSGSM